MTWVDVGLKALVTTNTGGDQIATFTLEDQTVGSIISTFVGWATGTEFGLVAPFNVLDDISLSGLKITYNFTKKKVDFTVEIGPINLGLFTITGITLAYNPNGNDDGKSDNKVEITINGSFAWQDGDKLSWEPDDPSTTPAPPGGGNKYLDLRLLALGQHVTVPGLVNENDVAAVIAKLEVLDIPKPPEIPVGGENQPVFAPPARGSSRSTSACSRSRRSPTDHHRRDLVAAGRPATDDQPQYFISLAVVFNDPVLYALRLGLEGPMAKIFAGLDFQVMYQQVSQNVGRYSAQIALPAIMRKFQIGVASITLPIFAIEIYTNGDFQIDLGFPWNEDFTRSFSIEVQAGPLPVVGSAGFYFGKLSSATTDKVPHDTRPGWFNPVIVFGFGAQVGLGKSIEAGILRAGFSVTVFGIIEGVIARWQPYGEMHARRRQELAAGRLLLLAERRLRAPGSPLRVDRLRHHLSGTRRADLPVRPDHLRLVRPDPDHRQGVGLGDPHDQDQSRAVQDLDPPELQGGGRGHVRARQPDGRSEQSPVGADRPGGRSDRHHSGSRPADSPSPSRPRAGGRRSPAGGLEPVRRHPVRPGLDKSAARDDATAGGLGRARAHRRRRHRHPAGRPAGLLRVEFLPRQR